LSLQDEDAYYRLWLPKFIRTKTAVSLTRKQLRRFVKLAADLIHIIIDGFAYDFSVFAHDYGDALDREGTTAGR